MSFADALKRLRAAAWFDGSIRASEVRINIGDLRDLIDDFDRIDAHLRWLSADPVSGKAKVTVRDEFAMAALQAMGHPKGSQSVEDVARWAYQMANAMMQERAR